jgi:CheY-like chemotaxis protein
MMPVMDGWDFRAAQLRDPALSDIPVVVISASGFGRDTIRQQLRAYEVFSKPLEVRQFLRTVRQACGLERSGSSSPAPAP